MGKFKLACHLIQFAGEQNETLEKVFREVAEAGWNGVEGIGVSSGDELVEMATLASSFVCILSTSVGKVLLLTLLSAISLSIMMPQRFTDYGEAIGEEIIQLRPILNKSPKL